MEALYRFGATDEQVAHAVGVSAQTIYNWQKAHPSFFEALKDWKLEADSQVERSLFQRAKGCTVRETRTTGQEVTEVVKELPPDTTAGIFWLKNRKPAEWRDKQDVQHGGSIDVYTGLSREEPPPEG